MPPPPRSCARRVSLLSPRSPTSASAKSRNAATQRQLAGDAAACFETACWRTPPQHDVILRRPPFETPPAAAPQDKLGRLEGPGHGVFLKIASWVSPRGIVRRPLSSA